MGLFGKKKADDVPPENPPDQESGTKDTAQNPAPLLPPSSQVKPPQRPPDSGSRARTPGRGPTPPGGLLPKPDWHAEHEKNPRRASGTQQTVKIPEAPTSPSNQKPVQPPPQQPARPKSAAAGTGTGAERRRPNPSGTAPTKSLPEDALSVVSRGNRTGMMALLREAVERGASDLHLSRGVAPTIRLDGYLVPLDYPPLTKKECEGLVLSLLSEPQRSKFEQDWELDLSLDLPEAGRFRTNVHRQRGGIEAAFRVVNDVILPLRRLGLPGVVEEIARKHSGLVLVTGPTGSGKTTTLASVVDQINTERQCMMITVEDPIEYVHSNKRSVIKQREVTSDTRSFGAALRHVLRQDPDVIVIGEMRDLETIQTALTAAETGHLVFATLHTTDASQTIDRIIDVFPPHQQEQVRIQVANTLQAIIAQQLIPVPGNRGRVVAVEILMANVAARKIVRSGKTEQLYTLMQTSWEQGMITMDKSLKTLYQQGLISFDDAISRCKYPQEFDNI